MNDPERVGLPPTSARSDEFGGPVPQGYLLMHDGQLWCPAVGRFPPLFDLDSGRSTTFEFGHGTHGSRPGGWFVATDEQRRLVIDPRINTEISDGGQQVMARPGPLGSRARSFKSRW